MVTCTLSDTPSPRIDVYMFDTPAPRGHCARHENVVDLLRVLVVRVGVPLCGGDAPDVVCVVKERRERMQYRACRSVLIHIPCDNHARFWVEIENGFDEHLWWIKSSVSYPTTSITEGGTEHSLR